MKRYALGTIILLACGCAMLGKQQMTSSWITPAAEGSAKFGKADNGNTSIDLRVKHLASPDRLKPPASIYVVWVRTNNEGLPQNVGALTVDGELNGELHTVTSMEKFELFVTAENSGQTQAPAGQPLMWTRYER